MPVPYQGPVAQIWYACHCPTAPKGPATVYTSANVAGVTDDAGPRCQGRLQPSTSPRETQRSADRPSWRTHPRRRDAAGVRMTGLGLSIGGIAGECAAARLHFLTGEIIAGAIVIVPLLTSMILLAVVVFGGSTSSDRVFRLFRWSSDKEEPQAPAPVTNRGPLSTGRRRTGCPACAKKRITRDRSQR